MAREHYLNWVEGKAQGLRSICNVPPFGRLDPFELAAKLNVRLFGPAEIRLLGDEVLDHLMGEASSCWSAGTLVGPNEKTAVVMNPTHDPRRQNASLMEELAHLQLGHKPTRLESHGAITIRSYDKTQEGQAYWVGAAALLPRRVLKGARTLGHDAAWVANEHMVSQELVHFRENVVGIRLPNLAA